MAVPLKRMPLKSRTLDALGRYLVDRYAGLAAVILTALADEEQRAKAMATPLSP
jgi:hypothetical protein